MIIGGDFNTQISVGIRGILLEQFAQEFGLCITNGTIPENINDWTFRSSMGTKRRLDYVLASNCFSIKESGPSEILNLGSDHRVVRCVLISHKKKVKRYGSKVDMKKWCPKVDMDGNASGYHQALRDKLELHQDSTMESIEKILYEAAVCPGVRIEVPEGLKPWQSEDIQRLILERRSCTNTTERSNISKKSPKNDGGNFAQAPKPKGI